MLEPLAFSRALGAGSVGPFREVTVFAHWEWGIEVRLCPAETATMDKQLRSTSRKKGF